MIIRYILNSGSSKNVFNSTEICIDKKVDIILSIQNSNDSNQVIVSTKEIVQKIMLEIVENITDLKSKHFIIPEASY